MNKRDIGFLPLSNLNKQPHFHIVSPCTGKTKLLSQHPEPFFCHGTLGPGIVIEMTSHKVLAPYDGKLLQLKNAGTEFILQANNGLKVLINLYAEHPLSEVNHRHLAQLTDSNISKGQQLAYFDLRDLSSPVLASVIILNSDKLGPLYYSLNQVTAGIDPILTLTKK